MYDCYRIKLQPQPPCRCKGAHQWYELFKLETTPLWVYTHNFVQERLGLANARGLFNSHCKLMRGGCKTHQEISRCIHDWPNWRHQYLFLCKIQSLFIAADGGEMGSRLRMVQIWLVCTPWIHLHYSNPMPYKLCPPIHQIFKYYCQQWAS